MFSYILQFIVKLLKVELEMVGSRHPAETASLLLDPPISDRKGNESSVNGSH